MHESTNLNLSNLKEHHKQNMYREQYYKIFNDKNKLKEHCYIQLFGITGYKFNKLKETMTSEMIILNTPLDGIIGVLSISVEDDDSIAYAYVTKELIEDFNLDKKELIEWAKQNVTKNVVIDDLTKVMVDTQCTLMGIDKDSLEAKDMYESASLAFQPSSKSYLMKPYVLTNKNQHYGASAILGKDVIKNFAYKHNAVEIVVIPSSVHELLLIPAKEHVKEDDLQSLKELLIEVNANEVPKEDVLSNNVYVITI